MTPRLKTLLWIGGGLLALGAVMNNQAPKKAGRQEQCLWAGDAP